MRDRKAHLKLDKALVSELQELGIPRDLKEIEDNNLQDKLRLLICRTSNQQALAYLGTSQGPLLNVVKKFFNVKTLCEVKLLPLLEMSASELSKWVHDSNEVTILALSQKLHLVSPVPLLYFLKKKLHVETYGEAKIKSYSNEELIDKITFSRTKSEFLAQFSKDEALLNSELERRFSHLPSHKNYEDIKRLYPKKNILHATISKTSKMPLADIPDIKTLSVEQLIQLAAQYKLSDLEEHFHLDNFDLSKFIATKTQYTHKEIRTGFFQVFPFSDIKTLIRKSANPDELADQLSLTRPELTRLIWEKTGASYGKVKIEMLEEEGRFIHLLKFVAAKNTTAKQTAIELNKSFTMASGYVELMYYLNEQYPSWKNFIARPKNVTPSHPHETTEDSDEEEIEINLDNMPSTENSSNSLNTVTEMDEKYLDVDDISEELDMFYSVLDKKPGVNSSFTQTSSAFFAGSSKRKGSQTDLDEKAKRSRTSLDRNF